MPTDTPPTDAELTAWLARCEVHTTRVIRAYQRLAAERDAALAVARYARHNGTMSCAIYRGSTHPAPAASTPHAPRW